MLHLPAMIQDLALILGTAAVVTLVFKRLRQPLVLGYLMAGFLVGPHSSLFPTVIDSENIKIWSEMGVIFLLFALGLEFSFKKLMRVGASAGITAVFEISIMLGLGFLTGKFLGWNFMDSLFLGGIISISSTSVILRTLEELGLKNKKFVGVVFGVLIIEDLMAVLLLVLLSTVALTREFAGVEMLTSLAKLVFFLLIWFVVGVFVLPSFLKKAQKLLTEETVLVIAVGLCLSMVIFANKVGFSSALGAFVTGSLLAETVEAERIHHLVRPVKDLFSAVFFVSVGMLIDPLAISNHLGTVLLISLVVIVGKTLGVTTGTLLTGKGLRSALQTGMTLSQIGEFSFIIATLGLSFKVISETLYPIAVAVSVITTFTTPYMVRFAPRAYHYLERILPGRWSTEIEVYSKASAVLSSQREWKELMKAYMTKILLNSVVAIGIFLFCLEWLLTWLMERQIEEGAAKFIALALTLIFGAPFFWGIASGKTRNLELIQAEDGEEFRSARVVFLVTRWSIAVVLMAVMVSQYVAWYWALVITLWMVVALAFVMSPSLGKIYSWFEDRFLKNFHDDPHHRPPPTRPTSMLAPWDAHITEFDVPPEASYVGKPLAELSIREKYGVTIALIERGRKRISAPDRFACLMPLDRLAVIGTDEQLEKFKDFLFLGIDEDFVSVEDGVFSLEKLELSEQSVYLGKNIRECGLREATQGLVVGIERDGRRILNPDSAEVLQSGDVLWIVGDKDKIIALA